MAGPLWPADQSGQGRATAPSLFHALIIGIVQTSSAQLDQGIVVGFGTPSQRAYPVALEALARVLHGVAGRGAGPTRG